jgi:membrane fusion protein (multidrug efflux system)
MVPSIHWRPTQAALAPVALAALLAGVASGACKKKEPPKLPPPVVEVAPVVQKDVPIYGEWIGTLDGFVNAEIRPQVEGYLMRQVYKEGSLVHKGDLLFEIDPRQFQAAYDQAKGNLAQYQAQLANAKTTVARYRPLAAEKAISQQELDDAETRERTSQANVESTKAALENAQLNLGWTKVVSPVDGISGIAKAQVGDLVNGLTVMTTVSQVDPIKVYFNPSEQQYMAWVRQHGPINQQSQATRATEDDLELLLADGSVYGHRGKGYLAGREVDVKTGTIQLAGLFPNPGSLLRPGQYGKVRVAMALKKGALLVPQRAVSELQGASQVAVVGPDNKVEIKAVDTGPRVGSLWVIEKGLSPGDRIVVEGTQKVRPGLEVNPKSVPAEAPAAAKPPESAKGT